MRSLSFLALFLAAPLLACAGRQSQPRRPEVPVPPSLASEPDPALAARIDRIVDDALAQQRVVGLVLLVARDGKLVYHRAAGQSDREAGRAMREDDVFRLASLTKVVVSAATLALVGQGKLSLDDSVQRWLPSFRPKLPDGTVPTITVRHLLTHTSGLGYGFAEPVNGPYHQARVSDGLDDPTLSLEENLRRIASAPLLFAPGAGWAYSLSHDVLGAVLAAAAHAPLPEVVARTVTGPLHLASMGFTLADPSRLVTPYAGSPSGPHRMAALEEVGFGPSPVRFAPYGPYDHSVYPSGGGGLVGNAKDFLRFLEILRTGGSPLFSAPTGGLLSSHQVGNMAEPRLGPGVGFGFGFSVIEDPQRAGSPLGAGSWQWGGVYGHSWWVDHQSRTSVVLLTNTFPEGMMGRLPDELRRAISAR